MGKRQIGELEVGELVSTLLISEIASIPIDTPEIPLLNAVIPLGFILAAEIILSHIKNKRRAIKRIVEGEPIFIIYNGELKQSVLTENRISINEVLTEMRTQGIADIGNVRFCILEAGGKLSFFEAENCDISLPIIVDGEIEDDNLKRFGLSREWLRGILNNERCETDEVFLMTVNPKLDTNIIYKEDKK